MTDPLEVGPSNRMNLSTVTLITRTGCSPIWANAPIKPVAAEQQQANSWLQGFNFKLGQMPLSFPQKRFSSYRSLLRVK